MSDEPWECVFERFHRLWGASARGEPYDKRAWGELGELLRDRARAEGYSFGRESGQACQK